MRRENRAIAQYSLRAIARPVPYFPAQNYNTKEKLAAYLLSLDINPDEI
ncbi:hypothetical protein [Cylindrospermopsis raciborskii]|nr:hypothetical protein [Cylindrospermopsis raciborskii]